MKIGIVCESVTGNTAQLAEALRFSFRNEDVVLTTPAKAQTEGMELILVGSWTDKGDCPKATAAFLETLEGKDLFLFGTCGYGSGAEYFETIYRRVAAHVGPGNRILGHYYCQGRMPVAVVRRYEAMLEANPDSERWIGCIENYNRALAHPNGDDIAALRISVQEALAAFAANT